MSVPNPKTLHELYGRELEGLLNQIQAGEVSAVLMDQATAERWLFRLAGALMRLQEQHQMDERGRCFVCRPIPATWWRLWPKRSVCTVYSALEFSLPPNLALLAVSEHVCPVGVRGTS